MPGPATVEAVRVDLDLSAADRETEHLAPVVEAVNDLVSTWVEPTESGEWAPRFQRGANMLAARIYRRRMSPAGVESFGELGAVYVQRNDPDIAHLLGLGRYRRLAVG